MKKKTKKLAFTLVEIMIASGIFAITLGGSILMSNKSRLLAQKSLVKEIVICAAQSRLNQILSMPFEDPLLDNTNVTDFFARHNPTAPPTTLTLEIRDAITTLVEDTLTLTPVKVGAMQVYSDNIDRFNPNTGPFPVSTKAGQNVDHYLGREVGDVDFDSAATTPCFVLRDDEVSRMTIDNTTTDTNSDTGFARNDLYAYALANDIDDFDGMSYSIYNVFRDVDLLVEVAVRPHYRQIPTPLQRGNPGFIEDTDPGLGIEAPNIPSSWRGAIGTNATLQSVVAFCDMGQISPSILRNETCSMGGPANQYQKPALDYYRDCLYKEICVTITWKFGENGNWQSFSMYGTKVVDADQQLIIEKAIDMTTITDFE